MPYFSRFSADRPGANRKESSGSTSSTATTTTTTTITSTSSGNEKDPSKSSSRKNAPKVNVYTHCGRHTDQYLFGGKSLRDLFRKQD
ncbi:hypothetical protein GGR50DRAFT_21601 [Xylaria sp. CBS 124048]|nr:hypothetical protein GGR50DRAFT_21601 [Xylaria sp. CBS 124048]